MTQLHWMDNPPKKIKGITWGVPWKQGAVKSSSSLLLKDCEGNQLPLQSWPLAFWPDGSVKWSGHTSILDSRSGASFSLEVSSEASNLKNGIKINTTEKCIVIDTKKIRCVINRAGNNILEKIFIDGRLHAHSGKLTAINELRNGNTSERKFYESFIEKAEVEQNGPLRAVIKISGMHCAEDRKWLPFTLRLVFFYNSSDIDLVHTFFFDGDSGKDFIKGLGLELSLPLSSSLFNRHAKFALEKNIYSEPSKLLLTRFFRNHNLPYEKQLKGEMVDAEKEDEKLITAAHGNTVWNDFKLRQPSSGYYSLTKRSGKELAYIDVMHGHRAQGLVYAGDENGGLAASLKNFWQKAPSALEIEDLAKETAKIKVWFWDPSSEAMDMRHYSEEHHMCAYEGFEEIRSSPFGIANTSEATLTFYDAPPKHEELNIDIEHRQNTPLLICRPEYYHSTKAAGKWALRDFSSSTKNFLERQLEQNFSFYKNEVEQRNWYGYWHYGDFMHSYDRFRHQWMYDLGGYAWQNTELMPNIWLWYQFLRTGDKDVFKAAEAMTRHNSEVDCYHFGEYTGLGSRHNVIHWGCSCKEARINMAILYKYYYYLTADERTGELLTEMKNSDQSLNSLEPLRGFFPNNKTYVRIGPDWSAYCSNWQTEWERTGNTEYKNKITSGIEFLKKRPLRLLSGPAMVYDVKNSAFLEAQDDPKGEYHMEISFGAPQIWIEIADLLQDKEWEEMLSEFGTAYLKPDGKLNPKKFSWPMFATSMAAYSANKNRDTELGKKAWDLLFKELEENENTLVNKKIVNTWKDITEDPIITTNIVSQWSLNTIICLELIGDMIEEEKNYEY